MDVKETVIEETEKQINSNEKRVDSYRAMLVEIYRTFEHTSFKHFKTSCDELLEQIPAREHPALFETILQIRTPPESVKKMALYLTNTQKPIYQMVGLELIQILGEPSIIPYIVPIIYSSHKPLQQAAIRVVISIKGNAESILEQGLHDRSDFKRKITIKVLQRLNPVNTKLLLLQLNSEDHVEVITAIQRLAETGNKKIIPKFTPLLSNPDISIRAAAIEAIGKMGGKKAYRILEDHLPAENFPKLRDIIYQYI